MKNKQNKLKAFTLIEILVAMTIFSIIMISVFMIFASANATALKIDITRAMQENTKNIVETIAKDLREQSLSWVSDQVLSDCDFWTNFMKKWDKLCFENNSYFLAKKEWDDFIRTDKEFCSYIKNNCYIVKSFWSDIVPLTNSLVAIKNLEFSVFSQENMIPKIIINYTIQPATRKWISSNLIKKSKIVIQTTLSDRFIKTK